MVKVITRPGSTTLGRVAKHAKNAERAFDAFFDFKPIQDKDLFWQPGLDPDTNPFVRRSEEQGEDVENPRSPGTGDDVKKDYKEYHSPKNDTWGRYGPGWWPQTYDQPFPTITPTEGPPPPPIDVPNVPGLPSYTPQPVTGGWPERTPPPPPPIIWQRHDPWPEVQCGQIDPITGITKRCTDAQIQIQTSKLRTQSKNGKASRKGYHWNHSRKKNRFRRRNYQRRFSGEL